MKMALIYIADDDINICKLLKSQLENDGFETMTFNNGKDLLLQFGKRSCDLVLTDIMMPELNGYDLCKEIRKSADIPIIMISAKDEEIDMIMGLELGSDDYISKPFSLRAVSIKIRNMLSRYDKSGQDEKEMLTCKDLKLDLSSMIVMLNENKFPTTLKEYELLEFLVRNKNQAFTREKIIENVWGYEYIGDTRQVDHMIKRLRKKILDFECEFQIETVWGFGYRVSD